MNEPRGRRGGKRCALVAAGALFAAGVVTGGRVAPARAADPVCSDPAPLAVAATDSVPGAAFAATGAPERRGTGDEPLDPRSTGWAPARKSPWPWILVAVGAAVVIGGTIAIIYYWNDRRAHFPDDTLGVRTFRP